MIYTMHVSIVVCVVCCVLSVCVECVCGVCGVCVVYVLNICGVCVECVWYVWSVCGMCVECVWSMWNVCGTCVCLCVYSLLSLSSPPPPLVSFLAQQNFLAACAEWIRSELGMRELFILWKFYATSLRPPLLRENNVKITREGGGERWSKLLSDI